MRRLGGDPSAARPLGWQLWLLFFGYAVGVALGVQLVILPYLLPGLHAGHGLFVGLDAVTYHQIAVHQAAKIQTEGWSAWTLRPAGQAPAGIASAIYALTVPEPWTTIPLHAVLHATAALVLFEIVGLFVGDRRIAVWATLPFFLYPSAMIWYTQPLKDGWFVLGTLLFVYGWLGLARPDTWSRGARAPFLAAGWVVLGVALVWVVRPYAALLMQGLALALALLLTGVFLWRGIRAIMSWRQVVLVVLVAWTAVGAMAPLSYRGPKVVRSAVPQGAAVPSAPDAAAGWRPSPWFPGFIDDGLYRLDVARNEFRVRYPGAGLNVDTEVEFRSARDVLGYLPRAAVIVLFAPFPAHWVGEGATAGGTLMRRVTGFEMVGLYAALALVPYALWRWRRRIEVYVIALSCLPAMLIFGAAILNVGALYRFRYGFVMTLAALGIASVLARRDPGPGVDRAQSTPRPHGGLDMGRGDAGSRREPGGSGAWAG